MTDQPPAPPTEADAPAPTPTVTLTKTIETQDGAVDESIDLTLNPTLPAMLVLEMQGLAAGSLADDPAARRDYTVLVYNTIREALPSTEYQRYRAWAIRHRCDVTELMTHMDRMIGGITARPTEGQQPSAGGLPETGTGSTGPGEPTPVTSVNGASPI